MPHTLKSDGAQAACGPNICRSRGGILHCEPTQIVGSPFRMTTFCFARSFDGRVGAGCGTLLRVHKVNRASESRMALDWDEIFTQILRASLDGSASGLQHNAPRRQRRNRRMPSG